MAIFYEHIKGCDPDNTYTSWIKWSNEMSAPTIKVGNKELGSIITSDATGQSIANHINFDTSVSVPLIFFNAYGSIQYNSKSKETRWTIKDDHDQVSQLSINAGSVVFDTLSGINLEGGFNATDEITASNIEAYYLHAGKQAWANPSNGDIKADNKCEAKFFNAVSDRRAKSNITPVSFSALTIVKNLPIYTFNYNDKSEDKVIGLVAQEAAEYNLDGFNMVDNLDASGENNDFMQMKESKLVYVLWKAVQELSAEVESLKAQLNNK